MSSLTIRLDSEIDTKLEHFSSIRKMSKSAIARTGIIEYINKQEQYEDEKNELKESFTISSLDEVRSRIQQAEKTPLLDDDEYEIKMDLFFKQELGLIR